MEYIINSKNLHRIFSSDDKEKIAVNKINLKIKKGTIFGLLGPNGAGKSTTIKMLTTLLLPTSGELEILGYNAFRDEKKIRPLIGFLYGGESGLYWQLSGRDNLMFFGSLFKIDKKTLEKRIDYWLDRVGLIKDQNVQVRYYSKGMKQRLHIARTLIHDPTILFMDEPTLGLDPKGTEDLRMIMKELVNNGKTIILTTHDMEEAQELCDDIAFIVNGEIVIQGSLYELQNQFQTVRTYEIEIANTFLELPSRLEKLGVKVVSSTKQANGNRLLTLNISEYGEENLQEIIHVFGPFKIQQIVKKNIDLKSIYLQLVNQKKKLNASNLI